MNAVAIITARGGSKRIPGKNKKDFLGRPILNYSIEAALASGLFEEVMVSTDDDEIAGTAKAAGAEVPFRRSKETADDYATTAQVLLETLAEYEKRGRSFTHMACIYPTAPFVTAEKLQKAMCLLREKEAAGVMPVTAFSFPPQRGMVLSEGRLAYLYPELAAKRSQDLEAVYHDCGQFYCYDVAEFKKSRGLLPQGYLPLIVSPLEVQDIDNPADWELAEMKYELMRRRLDGRKGV